VIRNDRRRNDLAAREPKHADLGKRFARSPEQIAGWLKDEFPGDENMRVSHETIYRSLFIQARGVLKKELIGHLRPKRSMRRPHRIATHHEMLGRIPDAVSIRERPAEAEDRAVPGRLAKEIRDIAGSLIRGEKRNDHSSRAAALAPQSILHLRQRECIAQVRTELHKRKLFTR
jgi:IS30 family transposase